MEKQAYEVELSLGSGVEGWKFANLGTGQGLQSTLWPAHDLSIFKQRLTILVETLSL